MKGGVLALLAAAAVAISMLAGTAVAKAPTTKTKTLSGTIAGETPGEETGTIRFKVVIKKGVVIKVKSFAITVPYVCDLGGKFEYSTVSATIPGPYKVTHINGHPNFFPPRANIEGRTWYIGANMTSDKATKAIGTVKVTSTAPGGGTCQNPSQEFVAK